MIGVGHVCAGQIGASTDGGVEVKELQMFQPGEKVTGDMKGLLSTWLSQPREAEKCLN